VETVHVLVRGGTVALGCSRRSTLAPRPTAEEVQIGIAMFRNVDALRPVTSAGCRRPWPEFAVAWSRLWFPEHSEIRIGVQLVGAGCPRAGVSRHSNPFVAMTAAAAARTPKRLLTTS